MNLEEYLGTDTIQFAPSGTMAIFSTLYPSREKMLGIPDQGGFKGILTIANLLAMPYTLIETEKGLIIPEHIRDVDLFVFSSFSGYIVENDVDTIVSHCHDHEIWTIEDISSGFSYPSFGKGDIVVCSTGRPKILECGWGGFAAYREGEHSPLFNYMEPPEGYIEGLQHQVDHAGAKLQKLLRYSSLLKDFAFDVLFEDDEGPSVFVRTENPKKILKRLNKKIRPDTGYSLFSQCPRFDRVQEEGFVIETIKVWERDEDEILEIGRTIEKVVTDV